MNHLFPAAFTAADVVAQYDVIAILFGDDMMPDMLDVLDAFDNAAPHPGSLPRCCRAGDPMSRRGGMSFGTHGRAEIAAEKRGPYAALVFRARTYAQKMSPDCYVRVKGRTRDPADVVNFYLAQAIRGGLTGEQIRCAMAEAGLEMPSGVMSLGATADLDLTQVKDSWLRYWCNIAPRVLVAGTRGELDGVDLAGRVYKKHEISEGIPPVRHGTVKTCSCGGGFELGGRSVR